MVKKPAAATRPAAIAALVATGIDVRVNIVGFALDDEALRRQFEEWARLGNGQYIDAVDAAELDAAVAQAVQPLYNVIDSQGNIVASGQVGGPALSLPAGTYRVEVLTQPTLIYEVVRDHRRPGNEIGSRLAGSDRAEAALRASLRSASTPDPGPSRRRGIRRLRRCFTWPARSFAYGFCPRQPADPTLLPTYPGSQIPNPFGIGWYRPSE